MMRKTGTKITFIEEGGYYQGEMYGGHVFLFDKEDLELVKNNSWHKDKDGYARSRKKGFLHRLIMQEYLSEGLQVDHINRNESDNRRSNLRIVTHSVNQQNKGLNKRNTTGQHGVRWSKADKKWRADIRVGRKLIYIGLFHDLSEAISARKEAEKTYYSIT